MTYEIGCETEVDFTWEREWRICCDELHFSPGDAAIILPDRRWARLLIDEHNTEQDRLIQMYSLMLDDEIAEVYRYPFEWDVVTVG